MLMWIYRVAFLLSSAGLLLTAYLLFGCFTAGELGFNPHPILPGANCAYAFTLLGVLPISLACIVMNILCWIIFAVRIHRKRKTTECPTSPCTVNAGAARP